VPREETYLSSKEKRATSMLVLRPNGPSDRESSKRFVGRQPELAEIRLAIDQAADGRGGCFSLAASRVSARHASQMRPPGTRTCAGCASIGVGV
jgi:hypothetical protein